MIIYKNGLINLEYSPATDVMTVELPSVAEVGISELDYALEIVAEHAQNYDIKRLMLDSSKVLVEQMADEPYKVLVTQFFLKLSKTRLEKIARVNSARESHEKRVKIVANDALTNLNLSIKIETFSNRSDALDWLSN